MLGRCYAIGRGTAVHYVEAVKWFRKSAEQGHAEALDGFRKSAEQGHAEAQYILGRCYYKGGVKVDRVQAVEWFRKSAEQGDDKAQYMLGRCYYYGEGVTIDHVEAGDDVMMGPPC